MRKGSLSASSSACPGILQFFNRLLEGGSGQYAPFGGRKKTWEEHEFELDKSVVSQKIQEGGHARVFFLVL